MISETTKISARERENMNKPKIILKTAMEINDRLAVKFQTQNTL